MSKVSHAMNDPQKQNTADNGVGSTGGSALIPKLREGCVLLRKRWSGDCGEMSRVDETATEVLMGEAATEIERLRNEVAQLQKNCTQIYDAMKKAEAEAKFFRTLVQSHRAQALPNT
jgi:uncharacterized protein (UPF0335 family)